MPDAIATLGLDTKQYEAEARRAARANAQMEASAKRTDAAIKKFGSSLAKILGVTAFASALRNSIRVTEEMQRVGDPETLNRIGRLDDRVTDMFARWSVGVGSFLDKLINMRETGAWGPSEGEESRHTKALREQLDIRREVSASLSLEEAGYKSVANELRIIAQFDREIQKALDLRNESLATELQAEKELALWKNRAAQGAKTNAERRAERRDARKAASGIRKAVDREAEMAMRTARGAIGGPGSELEEYQMRINAREQGVASAGGTGGIGGTEGQRFAGGGVNLTGEALTALQNIEKNTESIANPPNH